MELLVFYVQVSFPDIVRTKHSPSNTPNIYIFTFKAGLKIN